MLDMPVWCKGNAPVSLNETPEYYNTTDTVHLNNFYFHPCQCDGPSNVSFTKWDYCRALGLHLIVLWRRLVVNLL